ncbi:DUF992 domain-containing protein [Breoghania sp.]|uniref:DUF992 domain-containing protein n=1 Tax=Breoghania sp. TaxID=2065378 RepID=UPI0029CA7D09|nr:DUF992 domain-containing protein [Breoghania sp.]
MTALEGSRVGPGSNGRARAEFVAMALLACAGTAFTTMPAFAQGGGSVEVGILDCAVKSGEGTPLSSAKDLSCTFQRVEAGEIDIYFGQIRRVGLDLGVSEGGIIRWLVFASSSDVGPGALVGDYVGVSAEATLGVGLGANALVGGGDASIVLQPVSLKSQVGLNLAAGIAELELRSPE